MSQQAAFLTAIRENAEDDTAHLAYADWFSERGQPVDAEYAELIRLQCALARIPPGDVPAAAMLRHGVLEWQVVFLQKPDTPLLLVRKGRDVLNAVMQIELGERFVNDMAKAIGMP